MAKRGRHQRGGSRGGGAGRVTPKGTRPLAHGGSRGPEMPFGRPPEPDLMTDVRRAMRSGEPLDLLAHVSSLLAVVDPRTKDPFERADARRAKSERLSLDTLVESFEQVNRPETTAMLAVIAGLTDNELLRARLRRTVAERRQHLPAWVDRLGDIDVHRAAEMVHVLGDGDNVILGVRVPPAHELTVVVYIDHNVGTLVKDAFVIPEPIDDVIELMRTTADDPDTAWLDLDRADARARIAEAIDMAAMTYPPFESDTWPACRSLVEWATRRLPPGGSGYQRPEWTQAQRADVARRFLASPFGGRHRTAAHRDLLDSILWFGTDYGPGDPLRWSPVAVEMLLSDWIPRKIVADPRHLAQAPDVLRDLIRFSHAERGIRPALTEETLEAVDTWERPYLAIIRSPRPQGPMALLAAVGAVDPDGRWEGPWLDEDEDDLSSVGEIMLDSMSRDVGGRDVLLTLDVTPLPDESVDWDRIPDDIRSRVGEVAALCDRWCDDVLDVEHRTACRRLLTEVAAGDPAVFRRRAKSETAAAAICWLVGSANDTFHPAYGGTLVKDLMAYFGLGQSTPSQRGRTFLRAAGIRDDGYGPIALGSPDYLVSSQRRRLVERRDRYLAPGDG